MMLAPASGSPNRSRRRPRRRRTRTGRAPATNATSMMPNSTLADEPADGQAHRTPTCAARPRDRPAPSQMFTWSATIRCFCWNSRCMTAAGVATSPFSRIDTAITWTTGAARDITHAAENDGAARYHSRREHGAAGRG